MQTALRLGGNQSEVYYQLARALQATHHDDEARDEVIAALETAPGFKPAQKLLLELTGKE